MLLIENGGTELKREFAPDIKKTAVAFANTNGGKIYIGAGGDGTLAGADTPDEVSRQVASSVRDSIKPDITRFFDVRVESLGGAAVVVTILGSLISEQCRPAVKEAVFEGNTKSVFKSRKEFDGSPIKQLCGTAEYLDYFNLVQASAGKARRAEHRDYPETAIRESVLNALVHRKYGLSASTFVN
jgi:predicted HTH transcriptional regulator